MSNVDAPRPLAAAAERLRRRPGRPRQTRLPLASPGEPAGFGLTPGRERASAPSPTPQGLTPRLLDLGATAAYLGVSLWTVRDLEAAGTLRRVRVPLPDHGELRKLLFDRVDLDHLIERWKDAGGAGGPGT